MVIVRGALSTSEKLASLNPAARAEGQRELAGQTSNQASQTVSRAKSIASRGFTGVTTPQVIERETTLVKKAVRMAEQTGREPLSVVRAVQKRQAERQPVKEKVSVRSRLFDTSLVEQAREEQRLAKQFFPADVPKKTIKLAATIAVTGIAGGVARGIIGVGLSAVETVRNPIQAAKNIVSSVRHPVKTIKAIGKEFLIDPSRALTELFVYSKALQLGGRAVKRSPVGRFVQEEVFIRTQPIEIRPAVRSIVKSSKIQEKLNPTNIRKLNRVDFMEVKSLTPLEARAIRKTLQQTDSVVFGSAAARATAGKFRSRLPKPKDVDIATKSVIEFSKKFINNLPKRSQRNYLIRGQKVVRRNTGQSLFDVKPLSRLIPNRSLLTRRGFLPVSGYVRTITRKKGSILPRIKKKASVGALEVPTRKVVKIKGIKLVGFGEQTVRKGLGTLQVLIEKNVRRAKDPQAFVISLEVQIAALKRTRPKTSLGRLRNKRRIRILSDAVKLLKSKAFARLLERKVTGITKQYPLVSRINTQRLKKLNLKKVREAVKQKVARLIKKKKIPARKVRRPSKLPRRRKPSAIPSKLKRRRKPSRLPPSKLPSRIPASSVLKAPSKIPSIIPTLIPISRFPLSRLPTRLQSRIPSRLPKRAISKLPKVTKKKVLAKKRRRLKLLEKKRKQLIRLAEKVIPQRKFIYIPDLYSRVFGIKANVKERKAFLRVGRIFTGIEARKLI